MENKNDMNEKQPKNEKVKHILQLVAMLGLGIWLGCFVRFSSTHQQAPQENTGLSRFQTVYDTIAQMWVDTNEEPVDLETAAIKGFLENIGDPHTMYFTNEQLNDFTSAVEGSFAGIGVTYSMGEAGGYVSSVMEGTPASVAGILAGDVFTKVDGKSIIGMTSSEVKQLVTGDEGTKVTLTILRNGQTLDIEVTRQVIDSSVTYEKRESEGKVIGYLDINTFGNLTDQSVKKALDFFTENQIETIVIDLRDNTGGYLSSVQAILSLFVQKDTVLFSMQEKNGPAQEFKALNEKHYSFKQGYILTNEETASASEVMAGALSQILDYQLVGKTTYGKGTAQTQMMLSDMSSIKYTYARWLLPSGECINGIGIQPDIEVEAVALSDFYNITLEKDEVLKYDMVGQRIADMQHMLITLGFDTGRSDGYFDAKTKDALMAFEKEHRLEADGLYNKQDNDELISALINYFADPSHDACYQKVLEEMR